MKISYFKPVVELAKGEKHISKQIITLNDYLTAIKYGKYKNQVEAVRNAKTKAEKDKLKLQIPSVTISGIFTERSAEKLIEHSGLICLDIDEFASRQDVVNDPYTYSCFSSTGGIGLVVIVKIRGDKHKESFNWLADYYFKTYGIALDPAPTSVASLRYFSFDSQIYINERSKTSPIKAEPKKPKSIPVFYATNEVEGMIAECVNLGIDIAPSYQEYLNLAFALAHGFGEPGRQYFHTLCQVSPKYNQRDADKKYDNALKTRTKVTVGTFYYMLKQVGIQLPEQPKKEIAIAAMAKKANRPAEAVKTQLVQINGIQPEKAEAIVNNVYQRDDITVHTAIEGVAEATQVLMHYLETRYNFKRNAISQLIESNNKILEDEDINTIYLNARVEFDSKEITKALVESYIHSNFIPTYNPITQWIEANSHRNSIGNIDNLCKSVRSQTRLKDVFIRKWLISIFAAYNYIPVRGVLVLCGKQRNGKTEFFRRLLPRELKQYYAESKLDQGKDDYALMCERLILCDDEMSGKSTRDEKLFKELTSKYIFTYRAPYKKTNKDYKRLAVICGTSNDDQIIDDATGNTRKMPIVVDSIDYELYNSIDKSELFMEAYLCYINGESWELTQDEIAELAGLSKEFEAPALEREALISLFEIPESQWSTEWLTPFEIKDHIEKNTNYRIQNLKRFGIELKNMFGNKKAFKKNGTVVYCYPVKRKNETLPSTSNYTENQDVPF